MKLSLIGALLLLSTSAAQAEIYTWQDARGTVFYTNSIHEIPARYLSRARVLDVATGKKGGLATAQPATPPASAGGGVAPAAPASPPAGPAAGAQTVTMPAPPMPPGPAATSPSLSKQALERPRRAPRPPRRPSSEEEQ